jgi:flagellar hook-basal body complex protein FliE
MIEMPIGRAAAAYAAHKTAAPLPTPPVKEAPATSEAAPEVSFGAFLDRQVTQAVDTLKESERVSLAAVAGKASAQDVVRSVMAAEMTVQTVVAIRDRMVQAYQDIMRMAV